MLGVFDARWLQPLARALGRLGSRHVLVVHSLDGMDEISISAPTEIAEMRNGEVTVFKIDPEQFGLRRADIAPLVVDGPAQSLDRVLAVLDGKPGAASDVVALNAGAAIYAAGLAGTLADGVDKARAVLASGEARIKLDELVRLTRVMNAE